MGNRRKLTEVEEFYVAHNPEDLTIEQMAIKMSCNKNILTSMINTAKPPRGQLEESVMLDVAVEVPEIIKPSPPKPYEGTMFTKNVINKTGSGRKGITIMTKAATEIADEARKNNSKKSRYMANIHKPRGESHECL